MFDIQTLCCLKVFADLAYETLHLCGAPCMESHCTDVDCVQDMELPAELAKETAATGGPYTPPPPGAPPSQRWAAKSKLAVELCAAGSFPAAARMLELQLGIVNLEPLKDNMLAASSAAFTYVSGMPGLPSVCVGIDATWTKSNPTPDAPTTPATPFKMPAIETALRAAYKSVTDGKFQDAKDGFQNLLVTIPLVTVEARRQVDELKELVSISREYHTFTRCYLAHKAVCHKLALACIILSCIVVKVLSLHVQT